MNLIPTKEQWRRWSLPSKLTAIGTFLGLVSLLITLMLYSADKELGNNPADIVSDKNDYSDPATI